MIVDPVTAQIRVAVSTLLADTDAEDPSTADLLHAVINQLVKQARLLSSENRNSR
ncbi:hypothetical protein ACQP1G_24375 [Nocardia sp. CA-107356]|uniref:hypothetical protein n=1 Tax=Nocardia sp. CA-107356 TaxID=3239972 RepID=UPI003D89E852